MADRQNHRNQTASRVTNGQSSSSVLRRLHDHTPSSAQLMGFLTLLVSGGILLLLTGATVTATTLAVILCTPIIVILSPIWVPIGLVVVAAASAFISVCAFGVSAVLAVAWIYRYFRGLHPPGSDRVDYARSRIYDTATHVKDYAGGYLHTSVKDAAPGA